MGGCVEVVGWWYSANVMACAKGKLLFKAAAGTRSTIDMMLPDIRQHCHTNTYPDTSRFSSFFPLSSFPLSLCAVFTFMLASVQNYDDVEKLMNLGVAARTVAATNMNSTSSRAHTVFTVILTQQQKSPDTGKIMKKTSKINLVDLAGSERANATGATGDRLKEGCAINQSLSSLGNVINALAKQSEGGATGKKKKKKRKVVVPYRASKLYVLVHTTSTRCVWCF